MARKERNNVDYFPHKVTHGRKMFYLRSRYRNDGYVVWFMLMEELGKAEYHYIDLLDETQKMYLSSSFMVSEETLIMIINDLVKLGEFDKHLWENESILFNEKFVESISDAYKKRNNNCIDKKSLLLLLESKGRLKPDKSIPNEPLSESKGDGNTQRILKDIKLKKTKEIYPENFENYFQVVELFDPKFYNEEKWLSCYEKLIRIDGYSEDRILEIVKEFRSDGNWWKDTGNFETLLKLRTKNKEKIMYIDAFDKKMDGENNQLLNIPDGI